METDIPPREVIARSDMSIRGDVSPKRPTFFWYERPTYLSAAAKWFTI
eukprot:XP_001707859.1 Hypothetical protein GL50803_35133 [Giardia lamblia ATCC 50803]